MIAIRTCYYLQISSLCYTAVVMTVRNTKQRNLVMELMEGNFSHPTADEIYELARKKNPKISRGTVYRNLNFLVESGNIQKIVVPDGADHYDSVLEMHYHFHCDSCGRMFDVPRSVSVEVGKASREMESEGFSVTGHNLIFTGICPDCRRSAD